MKNFLLLLPLFFLYSCALDTEKKTDHIPVIVCTTGMLGDGLENILKGAEVEIVTLMKTGVDPHLYKATQGDVKSLMRSDIVVYNGVHLEGKMGDIFSKLENRKTVIVTDHQFLVINA